MKIDKNYTNVLICGASGGIGSAIALNNSLNYADTGVKLNLWARDLVKLQDVANRCEALGAYTKISLIDLEDLQAVKAKLAEADDHEPIDLVIFASGLGDIKNHADLVDSPELIERLAAVNFTAPCVIASMMAERMARRGHGAIVLIGSAASFHSLPFAASYAGSKAGLARFADALRLSVKDRGVGVTLVSPGFVDTEAAHRVAGPKPFLMSPDAVARAIDRAVRKRQAHLILPWPFALLRGLDRLLPHLLRDRLLLAMAPQ